MHLSNHADFNTFGKHDLKNNYLEWKIQKSTIDDPTAFKELVRTLCKKLTADRNSIKETVSFPLVAYSRKPHIHCDEARRGT